MISLEAVTKYYRADVGLEKVSLEIPSGQIVGIFGDNGSGKTTLLKAVSGLLSLTSGQIQFDEPHPSIAFMTEEGSYFPGMTAGEHGQFLSDFIESFDSARYELLLDYFALPRDKKVRAFSKGQKAKLEAALGFSKGCRYLVLDEPFSGCDLFTRRDFLKLMCESLKTDETILIATHLTDEIENFIDRGVILRGGRVKDDFFIDDIRAAGLGLRDKMSEIYAYDSRRLNRILEGESKEER